MISIIVAISDNYAIGRHGQLLCHLPNDLKHFKTITEGHTVIMGERTWFSLPRHPLPNRRNIVLTDRQWATFDGAETVYSIDEAIAAVSQTEEAFVIGGGMVYKQFMPLADRLYITHIHHTWQDADTFFPIIDCNQWHKQCEENHLADADNHYDYTFTLYKRNIN